MVPFLISAWFIPNRLKGSGSAAGGPTTKTAIQNNDDNLHTYEDDDRLIGGPCRYDIAVKVSFWVLFLDFAFAFSSLSVSGLV
jgi:hypothetical protein